MGILVGGIVLLLLAAGAVPSACAWRRRKLVQAIAARRKAARILALAKGAPAEARRQIEEGAVDDEAGFERWALELGVRPEAMPRFIRMTRRWAR